MEPLDCDKFSCSVGIVKYLEAVMQANLLVKHAVIAVEQLSTSRSG